MVYGYALVRGHKQLQAKRNIWIFASMCALALEPPRKSLVWADPTRRRPTHLVRATVQPLPLRAGSLIEPFCFKKQKTVHVVFHHYSAMPMIMRRFNLRRALPSIALCISRIQCRVKSTGFLCLLLFPSNRKTCGQSHVHGTGFMHVTGETVALFNWCKYIFGSSYNQAQMWCLTKVSWRSQKCDWYENSLSADLCFDKFIQYRRLLHNN